ncbi:hypothetical protein G6F31_019606 [Rhizopus arrhizus]|nr:hypothetical protein G6F31_019606 [Rhizopus arrhizus]
MCARPPAPPAPPLLHCAARAAAPARPTSGGEAGHITLGAQAAGRRRDPASRNRQHRSGAPVAGARTGRHPGAQRAATGRLRCAAGGTRAPGAGVARRLPLVRKRHRAVAPVAGPAFRAVFAPGGQILL